MLITSKLKKTISVMGLATLSSGAFAGGPATSAEALDQLTGPNQPSRGAQHSMCVSVTPYFIAGWGGPGQFHSLQINGVTPMTPSGGECGHMDQRGKCERGFIKITSTVPIACAVPVAL